MEIIALEAQIHALHQAANGAATTVNARGNLLVDRLQDIPNCVRQIPTHGVRWTACRTSPTAPGRLPPTMSGRRLQLLLLWRKPVPGTIFSFWSLYSLKEKGEQASTISLCNLM